MRAPLDLLRWRGAGALAHHRHGRLVLQLPLLALAIAMVAHGLAGPQVAPRNLATVLTWVHYRGLLIVAVLAIGNLFCAGCPMILARDGARRLMHPGWRWPRALRSKWPAIALFAGVLFAYELFDLWSLPRATAWLILGYFAAAVAVDVLFAGASFCKYVCPVGQFNFLASMMSPAELRVRDLATCRSCHTVDCLKGRRGARDGPEGLPLRRQPEVESEGAPPRTRPEVGLDGPPLRLPVVQRGCELGLFLPGKVGNLDCTFCFDCVRACPHDNIALAVRLPADEIAREERRSGIGRLARRRDLAALAIVFTFGALVNAFAMTAPAAGMERRIAQALGLGGETLPLMLVFAAGLVAVPAALIWGASAWQRLAAHGVASRPPLVPFVAALAPLGLGIWAAHYAFHFLTGALTVAPVLQSAAIDATGRALAGEPLWTWVGMQPGAVLPIQLGLLLLGALGSLGAVQRLAAGGPEERAGSALPWSVMIAVLAAAAAWVLLQPMDMRGVGAFG